MSIQASVSTMKSIRAMILHVIYGTVSYQRDNASSDNRANGCISTYHHQIGNMIH